MFWFKPAFLISDNQTSLQLPHDLLSDDGQDITFMLSTTADRCIVVNYPLSNVIKLSELDKLSNYQNLINSHDRSESSNTAVQAWRRQEAWQQKLYRE